MRRTVALAGLAVVFVVVAWSTASAGVDVQINADAPGSVQNEIRITRLATNPSNLVVAYNDNIGASASPLGVSYSLDGGATWTDKQLGIPIDPGTGGPMGFIFDPFIDSDSAGNVYAGYIAATGSFTGPSGIYIERSQDGGMTWSGPTTIAYNGPAIGPLDPTYRFNDRSDMTVDGSDNAHVVWIKDVGAGGQPTSDIYYAKSPPPGTPGPGNPTGLDFTGASAGSVAQQTVNDGANGTDRANAPDVAVASDGTVFVAWIDVDVTNPSPQQATLHIDRSTDGGATFGSDGIAATITSLAKHLSTAAGSADDARSGSYPSIAVDPSNPQVVYMAYAADPPGTDEADIQLIVSTDGGVTWSTPVRVNDDTTTNDQFHPALAVTAAGAVEVAWYDKRNAPNDDAWDVYLAQSTDGGATFSANLRITDQTFGTPTDLWGIEPWMGEYLGLDVDATTARIAFTSSVNDVKGDVFFDTTSLPPGPSPSPSPSPTPPPACDITGSAADDVLVGTAAAERICALGGRDVVMGRGGDDVILMGTGNDAAGRGGRGDDLLKGGSGNDALYGGLGADTARGGPGRRDRCRAEITRSCER